MHRELGRGRLAANVAFVVIAVALAGFGLSAVARRQWRVQRTFDVRADFATIGGVQPGSRVRVQGIDAGIVDRVIPPAAPGLPVQLVFRVDETLRTLVRSDALARIVTEGVVGAKVVEIVPGRPDAPPLPPAGQILTERPVELADLVKRAAASLDRLDAVTLAAEKGLGEINSIAETIRKGEGSLGKFVKDDEAYRGLVNLGTQGEKTLHNLDENLAAMKRTWPISRYFNDRAFFDRERVLYHPGAERESRTLREEDLFETGRALLTAAGKRRLDDVGAWFKSVTRPTTEVVIAGFTDDARDPDLSQILTQEQADSVRKYLVARHGIDYLGWFSSRKIAAVGFGVETPRVPGAGGPLAPPRRIEIILFTPQA
jgi:phospholipid/cholesterol/gamma-HCH transport system substrate-binding protein